MSLELLEILVLFILNVFISTVSVFIASAVDDKMIEKKHVYSYWVKYQPLWFISCILISPLGLFIAVFSLAEWNLLE